MICLPRHSLVERRRKLFDLQALAPRLAKGGLLESRVAVLRHACPVKFFRRKTSEANLTGAGKDYIFKWKYRTDVPLFTLKVSQLSQQRPLIS